MKFIRTNLTPGMIVLLIVLAVLFAFIVIPVLIVYGLWCLVVYLVTGSTSSIFRNSRDEKRYGAPGRETPFPPGSERETTRAAQDDDTIECEVISARTFDEDGREIH